MRSIKEQARDKESDGAPEKGQRTHPYHINAQYDRDDAIVPTGIYIKKKENKDAFSLRKDRANAGLPAFTSRSPLVRLISGCARFSSPGVIFVRFQVPDRLSFKPHRQKCSLDRFEMCFFFSKPAAARQSEY